MIKLIVGLGNPGPEYEDTRHNAGFWFVDTLARRLKAEWSVNKGFFGWVARASAPAGSVHLLKPQTFMNLSGKSVGALARFFKINPEEILVVHDELDIPAGQVKMKLGGGHAGHNGLKDTHSQLGSPNFWRLRLGIGHPGDRNEVVGYVLRKPPSIERQAIDAASDHALGAVDAMLAGDMEKATRLVHTKRTL
jgi:PTH1 family peptidyl-tRNA hydrolase